MVGPGVGSERAAVGADDERQLLFVPHYDAYQHDSGPTVQRHLATVRQQEPVHPRHGIGGESPRVIQDGRGTLMKYTHKHIKGIMLHPFGIRKLCNMFINNIFNSSGTFYDQ